MAAKAKEPRKAKGEGTPRTFDARSLRNLTELLRELLAEVDSLADRLDARGIPSVTVGATAGAAAFDRAEKAIKAWSRGVREAILDAVKSGGGPATGAG
jgi:hypothetical protein